MTYENMREHIKARYDHSPDWCKRVDRMADEQVCAIYYRLVRAGDLVKKKPSKPSKPSKPNKPKVSMPTRYTCEACNSTYVRDNPELLECEFCGSKKIERIGV